jgi:hypothetical protein
MGVILTGIGSDGAAGLLKMRRVGARTVGQDESSVLLRQRGWRGEPPFLCGLLSGSMPDAPGVRSVVEDDNIAWPESWDKELLDVSHEAEPIDRTIEDAGRVNAGAAQGGEKCHGFPVPVRERAQTAHTKPSPGSEPCWFSPMSRR